jgi:F-type H+-transporting ATPase subunit b
LPGRPEFSTPYFALFPITITSDMLFLADFSVIKPDPGLLIWTTVIFLIFWLLMSRFAFKPIMEGLKKREQDIQDALDQAKKAREDMANIHAEHERLIIQAREERSAILQEAKQAKEDILEEARTRAGSEYRLRMENAIRDIENQKMAAMVDLKNQAGKMAIEIAQKVLQRELADTKDQEAFAQSLVNNIKLN